MALELVNFSIVVVAEHHNPTILNPDFLQRHGIVPEAWGWVLGPDVFSTPPVAQVQYTNGVTILCEPSKLQVVDRGVMVDPSRSRIGEVAAGYVQTLPHVRYTGLGINFHAVMRHEKPRAELKERFLRRGPWDTEQTPLEEAALRLFYRVGEARLRLSLEAGEVRATGGEGNSPAIVAGANVHHDLVEKDAVRQIGRLVEQRGEYWGWIGRLVSDIFETQVEAHS